MTGAKNYLDWPASYGVNENPPRAQRRFAKKTGVGKPFSQK